MLPSSGSLAGRRDGDPRQRVDRGQRVGAGVRDGPGDRPDVGDVRRQLDEQRQVGGPADGGGDLARGRASIANWMPPAPTLGQRDVELDAGDARHAIEPARDLDVIRDRLAGDVDDHRHPPAGPRPGVLLDDGVDARVLQPDRVEHAARRLGHARRRVADARPSVVPLQQIAPSRWTSTTSPYSMP